MSKAEDLAAAYGVAVIKADELWRKTQELTEGIAKAEQDYAEALSDRAIALGTLTKFVTVGEA